MDRMSRPFYSPHVAAVCLLFLSLLALAFAFTGTGPVAAGNAHPAFAGATTPGSVFSVTWGVDINVDPDGPEGGRRKDHMIAVDPTNPGHVVAAFLFMNGLSESRYANSTDGGLTWTVGGITYPNGMYVGGSDNVAFDGRGTSYYSTLAVSDTFASIMLYTSTNGITLSTPVPVVSHTYEETFYFSTLAVDKRLSGPNAGSAYIFYELTTNSLPGYEGIKGNYSRDGGVTWSPVVQVSDPNHIYSYSRGDVAAIASDGTIYVAFEVRPDNIIFNSPELYVDRSTDGGVTWGTDRLISGAPIDAIGGPDFKSCELTLQGVSTSFCAMIRVNHIPAIAVSPTNPNTVYAVWHDGRWESTYTSCSSSQADHSDVAFSRTTDGGLTWSAPVRINDDAMGNGADQFMPTIAVAGNGTIGVSFYDRRYDPDHKLYDLSYTESTDGGVTWSANQRVSDVSSNPDYVQDVKGIDDLGYRKGLAYGPNFAIASWLDTRAEMVRSGEFYIDRGIITGPTPTLTPTAPVASPTRTPTTQAGGSATSTRTNTPATVTTATATSTPGACALQFEDVPDGSTFYSFVRCLACQGFLSGYPCGGTGEPCVPPTNYPYFRPSANITRGQLSKVVSNAAGFGEPVSGQTFEDVPAGSTFYEFIERLVARGVMSGYPCGGEGEPCVPPDNRPYFRPNNNATRGQISKIVAISAGITDPPGVQRFEDVAPGSTFYTYTQQLANLGVMSGYPCGGGGEPCVPPDDRPYFRPNSQATRGQVSKIVSNTFFPGCNP